MSHRWVRAANAISNYRWDGLPVPVDTDRAAMNRTYSLKRWVRGHVVQIDLAICAGLVLAGVKVFG